MLEIFIPTSIKNLEINFISKKFLEVLKKSFENIKVKKFDDSDLKGLYIFLDNFDYDLVKLLNGEFGEFYFLDYDKFENKNIFSFGISFSKFKEIEKNILNQGKIIENIQKELSSNKLLTNTKKEKIKKDIQKIFFSLSGILFVLLKNKEHLNKNHKILENYDGLEEYKAQAELFIQTTKNKKIELQKNIDKFENMINIYLAVLGKIFIN